MTARAQVVLREPFFGALALRLALVEDRSCESLWVDAVSLGYNPAYVATIADEQLQGLICHQVLHVANGHCWRRGDRDIRQWNDACDYAINPILDDAMFLQPDGALRDGRFQGQCAEQIFEAIRRVRQPDEDSSSEDGDSAQSISSGEAAGGGDSEDGADGDEASGDFDDDGSHQPGSQGQSRPAGEVRDIPSELKPREIEVEWKIAVAQAARAARMRGNLPGFLERMVEQAVKPFVDWRSVLHQFVHRSWSASDYTWQLPSRRYLPHELYLPRLASEVMPALAIFIDTSASIDERLLAMFKAEVISVIEQMKPQKVWLIYCDAIVTRVDHWESGSDIVFRPSGGGGTNFCPAFDWVKQEELSPTCGLFLTDLEGDFPQEAPDYPLLWVTPPTSLRAPWGDHVEMRN